MVDFFGHFALCCTDPPLTSFLDQQCRDDDELLSFVEMAVVLTATDLE